MYNSTLKRRENDMNTKYLEYIVEIEKCGSINKAANNLFVSQPNLSSIVKALEEEVGFSIFKRYNKGIALTNEGELFIKSAKIIIDELRNIERIPMSISKDSTISISCTYSSTFMESFMEFKEKYPAKEIEDSFKETGLIQTIQDVIEKRYKMSLFYCFDTRVKEHAEHIQRYNLDMIPIATKIKPRALVSSKGKYKNADYISFSQLKEEPFVTYENFKYEDWLKVLGRDLNQKALYIFDRGGLIESVVRGNYISVLMGDISASQAQLGCKTIEIKDFLNNIEVYLIKQKNTELSTREKAFITILKKNLNKI